MKRKARNAETVILDDNPRWYKDAVIYEVHVRAYCDGNGDGIGDIIGLTEKLDYLHDLGVTALWLLPHRCATTVTISPITPPSIPTTARFKTSESFCAKRTAAPSA